MNVIVSGLTAAGKTTHCLLLSQRYNLTLISAASVMAKLSGFEFTADAMESAFWVSEEAKQIVALRKKSEQLDLAVDAVLKRLSEKADNIVFDACGLPWISSAPALRIWLESSLESRLLKSFVSHRLDEYPMSSNLLEFIARKDQDTRDIFLSLYSFDIYEDREVFDLVLDISSLIRRPHILSAKRSIRIADEIISSIVGWRLEGTREHRAIFQKHLAAYGDNMFISYPPDISQG